MGLSNGDIIRVVIEYSLPNSSQALNVLYFELQEFLGTNADCVQDFVDFVTDEWHDQWKDAAAALASIIGVTVDKMNLDGTVAENVGSSTLDLDGTLGSEITASAVSGYIMANTAQPKTRGSKYVPGLAESMLTESVWGATAMAKLIALSIIYMLQYTNPNTGNEYNPGVLSRATDTFITFNETSETSDVPAYQRRRKPNVGS